MLGFGYEIAQLSASACCCCIVIDIRNFFWAKVARNAIWDPIFKTFPGVMPPDPPRWTSLRARMYTSPRPNVHILRAPLQVTVGIGFPSKLECSWRCFLPDHEYHLPYILFVRFQFMIVSASTKCNAADQLSLLLYIEICLQGSGCSKAISSWILLF